MEEDFIATIKLTTGEELISKVSYMPDDDSLVLDSPMEVNKIDVSNKSIKIGGFSLTEWITSTFDHTFVLDFENLQDFFPHLKVNLFALLLNLQ